MIDNIKSFWLIQTCNKHITASVIKIVLQQYSKPLGSFENSFQLWTQIVSHR